MKKLICALLSLILVFTVAYAAEITQENIDDLKKYEIMVGDPDGNMRLEDTVTRAEFAKMMCKVYGISAATGTCPFPDVASDHWAIDYITIANGLKLMQGDDTGTFRPEGEISYAETITVLIRLLGYEPMADARGGYPNGYIEVASMLGITDGVDVQNDASAIREQIGVMIAKSLDVPLMVQSSYGVEAYYTVLDGKNGVELQTLRTRLEPLSE